MMDDMMMPESLCLLGAATTTPGWFDPDGPAWQLLGRLHPLIVHFPIALVLLAALAEAWHLVRRKDGISSFARALVIFGAFAAIVAAWFGWINAEIEWLNEDATWWASTSEDPVAGSGKTLFLHRWIGLTVAGVLVVAAIAALFGTEPGRLRRGIYRGGLFLGAIMVGLTGHLGGTLVFGEGYLTSIFSDAPKPAPVPVIAPAEGDPITPVGDEPEALPVVAQVAAIFETHCAECHGRRKQKAGVQLMPLDSVFNDDPDFWVVQPGDVAESIVHQRISLPADDDDRMPPKGPRLTDAEVAAVVAWIEAGAPVETGNAANDTPDPVLDLTPPPIEEPASDPEPVLPGPADVAAIEAINARGGVVVPIAQNSVLLSANLGVARPAFTDADLALLEPLREHIVWLNLSRAEITDDGLAALASMPRLERLRLDHTPITDAGLLHLRGASVQLINLFSTQVTDAAAVALATMPNLDRVYSGQTGMTEATGRLLATMRPGIEVIGDLEFSDDPPPAEEEPAEAEEAAGDDESDGDG